MKPTSIRKSAVAAPAEGFSGLATALQIVTVAACLALGVAFASTLVTAPPAPTQTASTCPGGQSAC
jgi:hypothetical protein